MAEFKEKGEVDRPIVSTEETRQRGFSETSLEEVKIDDNAGDEQLQEFLSDVQEGDKIDKTKADEVGEDKTKADEVGEDKTKGGEELRTEVCSSLTFVPSPIVQSASHILLFPLPRCGSECQHFLLSLSPALLI